jgi:predicted membrane-bound mannosyltransferase
MSIRSHCRGDEPVGQVDYPILQGYPWLEKPPLYYWITIIIYKIFGVSEGSARIGPAICAVLAAASIFWLGSRLWSRRAGFWGGLIMLTSLGYYAYGRSASTDMPLTACFTIAYVLLAAAILQGNRPIWQTLGSYALLGLTVLAAGIVLLFWVLDEEGGSFGRMAHRMLRHEHEVPGNDARPPLWRRGSRISLPRVQDTKEGVRWKRTQ